jgi:hypothetical protein
MSATFLLAFWGHLLDTFWILPATTIFVEEWAGMPHKLLNEYIK